MPVLALHGFTGVGADFAPFAGLCGLGKWHCPNLPGHGPTPQLDCSPTATVDCIHTQVSGLRSQPSSQVSGLSPQPSGFKSQASALRPPPSILIGYSMGARAALLHAVMYPKSWDALILISPNPGIEDEAERAERRAVDAKLAQRIEEHGVEAFIEFWQNTPMIRSQKNIRPDWLAAMQANRKHHTVEGLATSLRQFGQGSCPNLWPELGKLTLPVLLLTGAEDVKYTRIARRMVEKLPTSNFQLPTHIVIDDVGHMPHLEEPKICAAAINDFLNEFA